MFEGWDGILDDSPVENQVDETLYSKPHQRGLGFARRHKRNRVGMGLAAYAGLRTLVATPLDARLVLEPLAEEVLGLCNGLIRPIEAAHAASLPSKAPSHKDETLLHASAPPKALHDDLHRIDVLTICC